MISCIIYDLDGTLIDSVGDIAYAVNRVRTSFGVGTLSRNEIRAFIGDGAPKLLARAVNGIVEDRDTRPRQILPKSAASPEELLTLFLDVYAEDPAAESTVYPGVIPALVYWQNQGVAQAVLTNKPHQIALDTLAALGLSTYFDLVVGRGALDDDGNELPPKPSKEVVDYILDQTGADRSETVIIGDGLADVRTAIAADIECIALISGYGEPEKLAAEIPDLDMVALDFPAAHDLLRSRAET